MGVKDEAAERAAALVASCRVASLATLDAGAPRVTMVPYAFVASPLAFVVLVSALSAHTRDLVADPRASLLVMEPERAGEPVHALTRLTVQGEARAVPAGDVSYPAIRAAYEARFAEMRHLFELGDFGLFALVPSTVRLVAGFAQAHSLTPESLGRWLSRAVRDSS